RVRDATDRNVADLIANYRLWLAADPASSADTANQHSSTLFDPVAVYLAMHQDLFVMEQLHLRVTDDGFTVIDPQARMVNVAAQWKNLDAYETFLANRLVPKNHF
ncbi:MAG: nucleoside hydrolase, partial [Verrucomicrobiota bacterium]